MTFGAVHPATAQLNTADIVGSVTDASGGVVPGVTVTITNTATQVSQDVVSDRTGNYVVNLLPPGRYSVRFELQGFKAVVREVSVGAGDRARADARLEAGEISEAIMVTAEAPLLQTDTSTVGATITSKAVQDLPLNGRNYIELVRLQPGVTMGATTGLTSGSRPDSRRQANSFSANGQPEGANQMLLDGLDNTMAAGILGVRPSVEGIAEVKISTNVFTAEVGRTQGAVVNVITKSGTNQLHGSAFEFYHDDRFDGNDFFAKRAGLPKPPLRQNQFGGSLGGPLVRNRTFFFADIEWLRLRQQLRPITSTVPTAYQLDHPGDFSDRGGPVLTASQINPLGLALFKLYPRPMPGVGIQPSLLGEPTANNFIHSPTKTQRALAWDVRIDHNFTNADRLYGRYSYNPVKTSTPGVLPSATTTGGIVLEATGGNAGGTDVAFPGNNDEKATALALNYVHVFGQTLLEVRGGWSRLDIESLPPNYGSNVGQTLGFKGAALNETTTGLTQILPAGYTPLGDPTFLPILNYQNVAQSGVTLTTTRGSHNLKVGVAIVRRLRAVWQNPNGMGSMTFGTSAPGSLVALLQGQPLAIARSVQPAKFHFRWWEPSTLHTRRLAREQPPDPQPRTAV